MSEFKLLRGPVLLLGCLIGAGAGTAQAQTESSAAPARGLEEITVTARRREESLQQVPLAITAFSAEQLEASRIDGLQDIAQRTPGLIYQDINGGLSLPVIRGLAQTNILTSDNNVGFFLNGVYLANSRALDLGLIESPSHLAGVQTEVCCEDMLVMICSPKYKLAKAKRVSAAEIAGEAFISRESGSGTREFSDHYFQQNKIPPDAINIVMELGSPEAIKGVVATGLGVSVLSRATVAKELKLGVLVAVPLDPPLIRALSVVTPRNKFRSRLVSTFVEFAMVRMRDMAAAQ